MRTVKLISVKNKAYVLFMMDESIIQILCCGDSFRNPNKDQGVLLDYCAYWIETGQLPEIY